MPKGGRVDPKRLKMVAAVTSAPESRFRAVDVYLKLLADAGLALADAEEAAGAGENGQAGEAIDRSDEALTALRDAWGAMSPAERTLVGRTAAPMQVVRSASARPFPDPQRGAADIGAQRPPL